jgi:3-dehydroquinate synthase
MKTTRLRIEDGLETTIVVGKGVLSNLDSIVGGDYDLALVVLDSTLYQHYAGLLTDALKRLGYRVEVRPLRGGESAKHVNVVVELWEWMLDVGATRDSLLVAMGGGSVLDTVGFVAATFMRGVDWVSIPTTSLSMFDAAVGGKTGINLGRAKNAVGVFYHPRYVVADVELLAKLPSRIYVEGFAELVKHALLSGSEFYSWLESRAKLLASRDLDTLEEAVYRSLSFKLDIVARDYRERKGYRLVLNLGHTIAHALEAATGYAVGHGRAVAVGLVVELIASTMALNAQPDLPVRVASVLDSLGLKVEPPCVEPKDVTSHIVFDKKRSGSRLRLPLLRGLGEPVVLELNLRDAVNLLGLAWRRFMNEYC